MTRIWNKHKQINPHTKNFGVGAGTPLNPRTSLLLGKRKVFVAMSGGVDSSVSAALLKKEGYDVTGVFMKVWQPDFLECSRGDDRLDAMRAAAHIGIPFLTFDFEKEYKKEVIDYMIAEYRAGRTPNPDVMCNKQIKFGVFLKKARAMGADMIATGHYARKREIKNQKSKGKNTIQNSKLEMMKLLAGVDKNKDQSYFLWTLTQNQLKHILFPVGGYVKPRVRELARKFALPNAERRESQGLCFLGKFDIKEFLKHYIKEKNGDVLNEKGETVGYHDGAFFLTIGQRHGFIITEKTPNDKPYYIIAKDIKKNTVTVSHKHDAKYAKKYAKTAKKEIAIKNVNFVSGETPDLTKKYKARIRYRQPLQQCWLQPQVNAGQNADRRGKNLRESALLSAYIRVRFSEGQEAATSGQSLVLYDSAGKECLGGGVIV